MVRQLTQRRRPAPALLWPHTFFTVSRYWTAASSAAVQPSSSLGRVTRTRPFCSRPVIQRVSKILGSRVGVVARCRSFIMRTIAGTPHYILGFCTALHQVLRREGLVKSTPQKGDAKVVTARHGDLRRRPSPASPSSQTTARCHGWLQRILRRTPAMDPRRCPARPR